MLPASNLCNNSTLWPEVSLIVYIMSLYLEYWVHFSVKLDN